MPRICISLTSSATMAHVPLAAFGYALRRAEVLQPLAEVALPMKTVIHTPGNKLMEALVLILAGGRATAQADVLVRPNGGLARAWGQDQFAQQSTLSQALDAFEEASLRQLQSAFETTTRTWSHVCHHDFRRSGTSSRRQASARSGVESSKKASNTFRLHIGISFSLSVTGTAGLPRRIEASAAWRCFRPANVRVCKAHRCSGFLFRDTFFQPCLLHLPTIGQEQRVVAQCVQAPTWIVRTQWAGDRFSSFRADTYRTIGVATPGAANLV